ncbi:TB2/DP1, HVA22 family-domain-containing protein [Gorgonomyces haynaldii]|nr:TB2/DP1, HVA22 family-domain-containing protein [Gorgonomyces haynaldii]
MMIPAFKTYQALKNEENTAEWSQYWIVWTVFSAAEVVLDSLFFGFQVEYRFPLYYELKLGLVLWLSLAKFKGAQIVYDSYISAVLSTHETLIDDFLTKSEQTARRESAKHLKRAIQGFRQLLLKTLMEVCCLNPARGSQKAR